MFAKSLLRNSLAFLALAAALPLAAQQAGMPPQSRPAAQAAPVPTAPGPKTPGKQHPPRPAANAAPGGSPGMVWVNLKTSVYHCYGSRYYGKTADGRYMTEAAAKNAGAKGSGGKTCPAK